MGWLTAHLNVAPFPMFLLGWSSCYIVREHVLPRLLGVPKARW